ncbi:MAG: hypothetical protein AAF990_11385 [Bacteroidota bacterium]
MKETKQHITLFIKVASFTIAQATIWMLGIVRHVSYTFLQHLPNTSSEPAFSLCPSSPTVLAFYRPSDALEFSQEKQPHRYLPHREGQQASTRYKA